MEPARYRIHHVAAITGVHPSTLRAWERRYGLLQPHRTATGHRLYSGEEVERVRRISRLAGEGTPYARIAEILDQAAPPRSPRLESGGPGFLPALRSEARDHAYAFDLPGLEAVYRRGLGALSFEETLDHVFLPELVALGELWRAGNDIVAEEHFLSAFVRRKLLNCLNAAPLSNGPARVVCACTPGEAHEIGLLRFTLGLLGRGTSAVYVGAATPSASVIRAAELTHARAVCISTTLPCDPAEIEALLAGLRELPGSPRVIVGGRGSANAAFQDAGVTVCGHDAELGMAEAVAAAH
jgi:DNA-binding transcriptional MerR regulator